MEIDNLELVLPFLTFENDSEFYYLQILQRKKENPQLGSNSRVIKNYYINSVEYLLKHYGEIKQILKIILFYLVCIKFILIFEHNLKLIL